MIGSFLDLNNSSFFKKRDHPLCWIYTLYNLCSYNRNYPDFCYFIMKYKSITIITIHCKAHPQHQLERSRAKLVLLSTFLDHPPPTSIHPPDHQFQNRLLNWVFSVSQNKNKSLIIYTLELLFLHNKKYPVKNKLFNAMLLFSVARTHLSFDHCLSLIIWIKHNTESVISFNNSIITTQSAKYECHYYLEITSSVPKKGGTWKSQHGCSRWPHQPHLSPPYSDFACGRLKVILGVKKEHK